MIAILCGYFLVGALWCATAHVFFAWLAGRLRAMGEHGHAADAEAISEHATRPMVVMSNVLFWPFALPGALIAGVRGGIDGWRRDHEKKL